MKYRLNNICILLCLLLIISFLPSFSIDVEESYPQIAEIEEMLFSNSFPDMPVNDRISKIETNIFGKSFDSDSLDVRTKKIRNFVLSSRYAKKDKNIVGYENIQDEEIDESSFVDYVIEEVNNERSFKGLLPLKEDTIAMKMAREHASNLIIKGYLSYFDLKQQGPDERYTITGGTGAVNEVVKGFQIDTNGNIKLTALLAKQLVQAIMLSHDDSQIMYSPYLTDIGYSFALSSDKKRFVSVIEFITKGGDFEPIKTTLNFGEKLSLLGKINHPYKFKAISVAYYDKSNMREISSGSDVNYFDNESLSPYFPPQDFIAYGDLGKGNLLKVLKGLGIIGAIGAAPFTGGATAVLAPALLSSLQNGPPREIPLKGGVKVRSKKEFSGEIDLNYQGRSGTYFVSVLAELPGINFPIVISRRVVRVNSPLMPVG